MITQRHVLTIQKMQKTVEIPQVQFKDMVVDEPVVRKTMENPQVQYFGRTVDVPMAIQRQRSADVPTPGSHNQESSENHELDASAAH